MVVSTNIDISVIVRYSLGVEFDHLLKTLRGGSMKKALIFFDIDGTLLDDDKQLPRSTKQAIRVLKEKGHEVAIASGRAPYFFQELRAELGIDSYICFNGQYVVYKGELIYENILDATAFRDLERFASTHNHPLVFMGGETFTANQIDHPYIIESIQSIKVDLPSHDPNYFETNHLYQALLFCTQEEEHLYTGHFPLFSFVRWHPFAMDVLPKGGSKANGIAQYMKRSGFSQEDIYVFGDGLNDLEMLAFSPHSVAMGNAPDEVKQQARYVTKHVNDDGIVHGLKLVGLLP